MEIQNDEQLNKNLQSTGIMKNISILLIVVIFFISRESSSLLGM